VIIKAKMLYIVEVSQSLNKQIVGFQVDNIKEALKVENYEYKLELNNKGEIIGGEWISSARPDFIWKRTAPEFSGYMEGLKGIYEKSIKGSREKK